ncbi:hypothetical protein NMY22_g19870 [Coprinellus aureogranulatus]|nr:hypothetical protein NMY22_g19870 [Coprinellus aureogranulatus]
MLIYGNNSHLVRKVPRQTRVAQLRPSPLSMNQVQRKPLLTRTPIPLNPIRPRAAPPASSFTAPANSRDGQDEERRSSEDEVDCDQSAFDRRSAPQRLRPQYDDYGTVADESYDPSYEADSDSSYDEKGEQHMHDDRLGSSSSDEELGYPSEEGELWTSDEELIRASQDDELIRTSEEQRYRQ